MHIRHGFGAAVVALLVAGVAAPDARAQLFDAAILESVVSVLPEWPAAEALPERPEGTAVAVLPGGYLATNGHVLGRATRIRIRLADGRVLPAERVGVDRLTDIALIRAPLDLPVPATAPPPPLGARVCAVGNPFGLGLSVTCGVVSGLHRTGTGFNGIEDFIQTDAVVNPGGSGGALVDADGRLVGLVSAIFTKESDADIGVNFAASMRLVMRVAEDLEAHGRVVRGSLGLKAADLSLDERAEIVGARVTRIDPGGAAAAAGLRVGDVIVAVADRAIRKASDVTSAVHMHRIGEPFEVAFLRDGERRTATVTLAP
ncbi:MAG: S1C family serine protease [Alphaproteobacteria bacterium]